MSNMKSSRFEIAPQTSDFQAVIERALGIACDYLVPRGLDHSWRELSLSERYYLRALDIESRGERRKGMYEELARGFGVTDIRPLLESDKANGARMKTPTKFAQTLLARSRAVRLRRPRCRPAEVAVPLRLHIHLLPRRCDTCSSQFARQPSLTTTPNRAANT
ncbi:MAG UNVERIFIED_CONTAM: hypothetical protein LVR18_19765 [Planctomycetaceae bacterium]|jgi:hypothetical protein